MKFLMSLAFQMYQTFSGKISDEPTYSGYEVDPSQGDLFEGDISGVELKAAEDKVEGQLSFEKVNKTYYYRRNS